jgi:hypothetical protein
MTDLMAADLYGIGTTSSNWQNRLATHLRAQAHIALSLQGGAQPSQTLKSHAAALEHLSNRLLKVGVDDATHLLGMAVFQISDNRSSGEPYMPSPNARRVIAAQGRAANPDRASS